MKFDKNKQTNQQQNQKKTTFFEQLPGFQVQMKFSCP